MPFESDPDQYARGGTPGERPVFVIPRQIADPYVVIILGSSHIRRLHEYISSFGITNCGLNVRLFDVTLYGMGGMRLFSPTASRRVAHHISCIHVHTPDLLILTVGSNDIMSQHPNRIAHALMGMAGYAIAAGVRHVSISLILFRGTSTFNARVMSANLAIMRCVRRMNNPRIRFWRHRGMVWPRPELLSLDGVHLNARGNYRLYRSLRGCILRNNNRL